MNIMTYPNELLEEIYYNPVTKVKTRYKHIMGRSLVAPGAKISEAVSKSSSVRQNSRASGDAAFTRCCRLCGGERGLRHMGDSCIWQGVEDTYDQLLSDCFDVKVTPCDGMICDRCITQLRSTQKFRALVHAAFEKTSSECTSILTTIEVDTEDQNIEDHTKPELPTPIKQILESADGKNVNEKILQLLSKKISKKTVRKRKEAKRRPSNTSNRDFCKRTIVICSVCGHRYPMVVQSENSKIFICSRCKLKTNKEQMCFCNKCNVRLKSSKMKEHNLALHSKIEGGRKISRLSRLPKRPSQLKNSSSLIQSRLNTNYQCSHCPKRYTHPKHLTEHMTLSHEETFKCDICGKDMRTRNLLDQHLRSHTGQEIYECDICKRVFNGKKALRVHYLMHDKFR